jgi:hypothetical protein
MHCHCAAPPFTLLCKNCQQEWKYKLNICIFKIIIMLFRTYFKNANKSNPKSCLTIILKEEERDVSHQRDGRINSSNLKITIGKEA